MPTRFILNDAVIIKEKIKPSSKTVQSAVLKVGKTVQKDSLVVEKDSLGKP
jgi:hypothetical protein